MINEVSIHELTHNERSLSVDLEHREYLPRRIAEAGWDKKALGLKIFDVRGIVDYTDFIVVCSGNTDRQVAAIAQSIERTLRDEDSRPIGVEGGSSGNWILLDYADVVVHVFSEAERDVYGLDSLWHEAPTLELEPPPGLDRPRLF